MKATTIIALAAGFTASLVSAQGLESIPSCALSCALTSLGSTGCGTTDIACICQASSFITSLIPCVQGACSAAEYENTVVAAGALCQGAGVTLSIPGATATATTAATSAPMSTASVSATMTTMASEYTSMTMSTVMTNSTTTTAAPMPSGNGTVTQPPTPSGTDDSGAGRNAVAFGGLGAVVALVAALL